MANESDNVCIVCFKNATIFSVGSCEHKVCFECSTRMRVLCRQNECPICRQDMQLVAFTTEVKPFEELRKSTKLFDDKYKIAFASPAVRDAFYKLLEHSCKICNGLTFKNFQGLLDHMRKVHELFYCQLCVENVKILTSERRCYNRSELGLHRRKGDPDDKSHRGHPLCQFCDTRYMDNDDLYRHLRRDHLYCHFCDADGQHMYYSSYDYLREHFRLEHFLCEEGTCVDEKFTPVFRTEIDLRAHRASEHGRTIGKAATKQARTLELEFTLKPRARPQDNRRRGRTTEYGEENGEMGFEPQVNAATFVQPAPTPSLNPNDFPTLGDVGGPSSIPLTNLAPPQNRTGALTIKTVARHTPQYDQHFPGLPTADTEAPSTSVRVNINQPVRKQACPSPSKPPANVSIQVNHRPARSIRKNQDDFPALSAGGNAASASSTWVSVSAKKPETKKAPVPAPQIPKPRDDEFPSLTTKFTTNLNFTRSEPPKANFVSLGKTVKQGEKKASSLMIPVEKSWPEPEVTTTTNNKSKTKKKKKGGNEDTAKKKESPEKDKLSKKERVSKVEESALAKGGTALPHAGKPLPTASDWFNTAPKKNEEPDSEEEINQIRNDTKIDFTSLGPSAGDPVLQLWQEIFAKKLEKPPPGFAPINGVKGPPPGLSIPMDNGLTFTNSSGESFPIVSTASYMPPADFDGRNQQLVTKVNEILLNDTSLEEFREKSRQFRQMEISADAYYKHCLRTMGAQGTMEVLPELIALLPDIKKQQELFQVLIKEGLNRKDKFRLEGCATCQQVVSAVEMKHHLANHFLNRNSFSFK